MKKILLSITLLIYSFVLFSQNRCYIKINFNECINCISFARQILDISPQLLPKIVMLSSYKEEGGKLLKETVGIKWDDANILYSDSLYNKLSQENTSSIHIYNVNNQEIYKIRITNIEGALPAINSFTLINPKLQEKIKINDTLIFSNRCQLNLCGSHISIDDYLLNKGVIAPKNDLSKINLIKGSDFDRKTLHQIVYKDLKKYEETILYDKELLKYNKNHCKIESIWVDNDTPYLFITLPYPEVVTEKGKNILNINNEFMIMKYYNNVMEPYTIEYPYDKGYDIDQSMFYMRDGKFYLTVFKNDLKGKNYLLAKYKLVDKKLVFEAFEPVELPSFFRINKFAYDYSQYSYHYPYIFFEKTPEYLNLKTNTINEIPISVTKKITSSNSTDDFTLNANITNGKYIKSLYQKKSKLYISLYEIGNSKLLINQEVNIEGIDNKKSNIVFLDWSRLLFLNSKNEFQIVLVQ